MSDAPQSPPHAFTWNAGAWFGGQLGVTTWILILGLLTLAKDALGAWICLGSWALLNGLGVFLWRGRTHRDAYVSMQLFLLLASVLIAVVVVAMHARGLSEPAKPGALVSTDVPYWAIAAAPALMVYLFFLDRALRRRARGPAEGLE